MINLEIVCRVYDVVFLRWYIFLVIKEGGVKVLIINDFRNNGLY